MSTQTAPPPAAPLSPREAYRLWAPSYDGRETAVSWLDDRLVGQLSPPPVGLRVLDAGCGTGRRLRAHPQAALRAGADLSWEMLAAEPNPGGQLLSAADVRALPFRAASFDLVWCRLVLGHLANPAAAYAELARVCRPGATLVVTDFHPRAARAGHRRSFRDAEGGLHEVEHHLHEAADHQRAAAEGGLELLESREGTVGPELLPFYQQAGRLDRYHADLGLPIVLALALRRVSA